MKLEHQFPNLHQRQLFRKINHSKLGNQITVVRFTSHKFQCLDCGKYFNLKLQGVLPKRQSTENFRLDVYERHHGGVTKKYLSTTHDITYLHHSKILNWSPQVSEAILEEYIRFNNFLC